MEELWKALIALVDKIITSGGVSSFIIILFLLIALVALSVIAIMAARGTLTKIKLGKGWSDKLRYLMPCQWFKKRRKPVIEHPIFAYYDILMNDVRSFRARCKLRVAIFSALIEIRFDSHKEQLIKLCSADTANMESSLFKTMVTQFLSDSHSDWMECARKEGIAETALNKFDDAVQDFRRETNKAIDIICDATAFHETNEIKIIAILDVLAAMEWSVVDKLSRTLDSMNGELSKLAFKKIRCCNCSTDCQHQVDKSDIDWNTIPFYRVLIVEDDKISATTLSTLLTRKYGRDVYHAATLADALAALNRIRNYDLAIIDVKLPDGNGLDLEKMMMDQHIPVAYHTAIPEEQLLTKNPVFSKTTPFTRIMKDLINAYPEMRRRAGSKNTHQTGSGKLVCTDSTIMKRITSQEALCGPSPTDTSERSVIKSPDIT